MLVLVAIVFFIIGSEVVRICLGAILVALDIYAWVVLARFDCFLDGVIGVLLSEKSLMNVVEYSILSVELVYTKVNSRYSTSLQSCVRDSPLPLISMQMFSVLRVVMP